MKRARATRWSSRELTVGHGYPICVAGPISTLEFIDNCITIDNKLFVSASLKPPTRGLAYEGIGLRLALLLIM